jgi:hypothetical protein
VGPYGLAFVGASAFLAAGEPVVQPGESTTRTIKIRNTGQVVDNFLIDVVGDAAGWATAEPKEVNLFPGAEAEATITFSPPKSPNVRAGTVPFAVRVLSREDTGGSVVEEGEIEVAPFSELAAEIVPRTIKAKRRGKAEVAVDNVGNIPINVQLLVEDPEQQLRGTVDPPSIALEPGRATFANVNVRPVSTFWRGAPKTLPYQVAVIADDGRAPVFADGIVLQEQILPKWLLKALLLALAVLLALFILWQTVFKETIESAAREAAEEEAAEATEQAEAAAEEAAAAGAAAEEAADSAAAAEEIVEEELGVEVPDTGPPPPESEEEILARATAADFRLAAPGPAPGEQNAVTELTADRGADQIFVLTDVVLQNPNNDLGRIQILRAGEVLIESNLANFRDLDYHWVKPIRFNPDQPLQVRISCQNSISLVGCSAAASISGTQASATPPAA